MPNIFLNSLPDTAEGVSLVLTEEQDGHCRTVCWIDDKGGAVFAGFWNFLHWTGH